MKKRIWIYLTLIVLCLAVFFGYRLLDQVRTDNTPPVFDLSGELLQVSVADGDSALLEGVTAVDEVDGDVTASVVVENVVRDNEDGTVTVTYAAFDRSGNVAKVQRKVEYTDYESPKFGLIGPLVFNENSGFDVLSFVTAEDMLDGDISHWVRATSLDENSVGIAGDHEIQFRVTNSLGDTVQIVLPVEVNAVGTYQGTLELSEYLVYVDAGGIFDEKDYLVSYTLGGVTHSLEGRLGDEFSVEIVSGVDTEVPGIYEVTYTVTYTKNATSYTGYSKLIVVVEG